MSADLLRRLDAFLATLEPAAAVDFLGSQLAAWEEGRIRYLTRERNRDFDPGEEKVGEAYYLDMTRELQSRIAALKVPA